MKFNQLWQLLFLPAIVCGQTRSVMVNADGEIVAPPNVQILEAVESVGGSYLDEFFTVSSAKTYTSIVGSSTTNTVVDVVQQQYLSVTAATDYQILTTEERNNNDASYVYASSNEAVAMVDSSGYVSWVSNGDATITITLGAWSVDLPLTFTSTSQTITNILTGVDGYLRYDLTNPIDTALTADAGANDDELFDTHDWATHTYVRNASAWAYAATGSSDPWTGLAVWRTGKTSTALGQSIRGTAISPNVIAFAWHNRPPAGTEFKYLGTDNEIYTRTSGTPVRIGATDAGVAKLDSDLPAEVHPLEIFDGALQSHFLTGNGTAGWQFPVIATNRNLQASVYDVYDMAVNVYSVIPSQIPLRNGYFQQAVSGDSGSPVMAVVDTELVLMFTWYTPFGGSPFVDGSALTAAISAVGGIAPTVIDLDAYPTNAPPSP